MYVVNCILLFWIFIFILMTIHGSFELPDLTHYLEQTFQNHSKPPELSPQHNNKWVNNACDHFQDIFTLEEGFEETNDVITPPPVPVNIVSRGVLFCHQNLNSIRNKFDELKWFIEGYKPAVCSDRIET